MRNNKDVTTIGYKDAEELAKEIGKTLYQWVSNHPNTNERVCGDIVLSTLEGYISGRVDSRKYEEENEDEQDWSEDDDEYNG